MSVPGAAAGGEQDVVAVIGGAGLVADAIVRRLRADFQVKLMQRGDALEDELAPTDAVVILEAASPALTENAFDGYAGAAASVAQASLSTEHRRVMTVTFVPAASGQREKSLRRFGSAEEMLRAADAELLVLRSPACWARRPPMVRRTSSSSRHRDADG